MRGALGPHMWRRGVSDFDCLLGVRVPETWTMSVFPYLPPSAKGRSNGVLHADFTTIIRIGRLFSIGDPIPTVQACLRVRA